MSKPKHHIRQEVCSTRAPYRDARKPTAVKVYTVHHESKYLLVQGVSAVGATNELVKLFETVGDVEEHTILDDYPSEQFTEVHLIKYKRIQSARFAKRKLDDWSFYGGVLHVCYAPEFETVQETRQKLRERRCVVEAKTKQYKSDGTYSNSITQSSQSSSSNTDEPFDGGTSQHHSVSVENGYDNRVAGTSQNQRVSIENGYDNRVGGTSQNYNANVAINTQYSEQVQNQTITASDIQQYGVHGMPPYGGVNGDSYYGEQSVPSQQNAQNFISDNGSIVDGVRKAHHSQTPLTYAEQVVQQAHSLQNYGKSSILNTENKLKRPNLDDHLQTVNENAKSSSSMLPGNEEELVLPPPPKQMRSSESSSRKSQNYGGAKVPSAQATFPANFDARTDRYMDKAESEKIQNPKCAESSSNSKSEKIEFSEELGIPSTKTMQEKVEDNLKSKNIVIKDFSKKGTVPKFIPRQAQLRNKLAKTSDKNKTDKEASKHNELNREIRKNAFKLGKTQGPADLGPSTSNEGLDPKEKSVMDSMLQIRKKLTKVKD